MRWWLSLLLPVVVLAEPSFRAGSPGLAVPGAAGELRSRGLGIEELALLMSLRSGRGYVIGGSNVVAFSSAALTRSDLLSAAVRLGYGFSSGDGVDFWDRSVSGGTRGDGGLVPPQPGAVVPVAAGVDRRGWLDVWLVDRSRLESSSLASDLVEGSSQAGRRPSTLRGLIRAALMSSGPGGLVTSGVRDVPISFYLDRLVSSSRGSLAQHWHLGFVRRGSVTLHQGRELRYLSGIQSTVTGGGVVQDRQQATLPVGVTVEVTCSGGDADQWRTRWSVTSSGLDNLVSGLPQTHSTQVMSDCVLQEGSEFQVVVFSGDESTLSRSRHLWIFPSRLDSSSRSEFSVVARVVGEDIAVGDKLSSVPGPRGPQ